MQMDHLISASRPDLMTVNKKKRTCQIVDFAVPADHRVKLKGSDERDKYLDHTREQKKTIEYERDHDTISNQCAPYSHQKIGGGTGGLKK